LNVAEYRPFCMRWSRRQSEQIEAQVTMSQSLRYNKNIKWLLCSQLLSWTCMRNDVHFASLVLRQNWRCLLQDSMKGGLPMKDCDQRSGKAISWCCVSFDDIQFTKAKPFNPLAFLRPSRAGFDSSFRVVLVVHLVIRYHCLSSGRTSRLLLVHWPWVLILGCHESWVFCSRPKPVPFSIVMHFLAIFVGWYLQLFISEACFHVNSWSSVNKIHVGSPFAVLHAVRQARGANCRPELWHVCGIDGQILIVVKQSNPHSFTPMALSQEERYSVVAELFVSRKLAKYAENCWCHTSIAIHQ
jgi:hypothetical protein